MPQRNESTNPPDLFDDPAPAGKVQSINPLIELEDFALPEFSKDKPTAIRQAIDAFKSLDKIGILFDRGMGLTAWLRGKTLLALEPFCEKGDWEIIYKELGKSQASCWWYKKIAKRFTRQQAQAYGYDGCREVLENERASDREAEESQTAKQEKSNKGQKGHKGNDGDKGNRKKKYDVRAFQADARKVCEKTDELLKRSKQWKHSQFGARDAHAVLTNCQPFVETAAKNLEECRRRFESAVNRPV